MSSGFTMVQPLMGWMTPAGHRVDPIHRQQIEIGGQDLIGRLTVIFRTDVSSRSTSLYASSIGFGIVSGMGISS